MSQHQETILQFGCAKEGEAYVEAYVFHSAFDLYPEPITQLSYDFHISLFFLVNWKKNRNKTWKANHKSGKAPQK